MDINQLRALVRKRQKVAANKIARLKSQGLNLEGTKYDARVPDERISRYTRSQLEALHKRVNAFNRSDTNHFIQLHKGVTTVEKWTNVLKAQEKFNSVGERHYNAIKDLKLPGQDETIEQRDAKFRDAKRKRTYGDTAHRPYFKADVNAVGVNGEEVLNQLAKDFKRRTTSAYLKKEIAKGRYQLMEMLKSTGDTEIMEMVSGLNDRQFDVVWNYTNLANLASTNYENIQDAATKREQDFRDKQSENSSEDIAKIIEWGTTLFKKTPRK